MTLPAPGDITAGGFLLGLAAELGKDYKDPAQMKEVVDWVITNIGPNVVKYTSDRPRCSSCSESGADRRGRRSGTASPGSSTSTATRTPPCWCPRPSTRPTATCGSRRARRTRCSPRSSSTGGSCKDVQFPNAWPIDHGPWSELSEGFLGPDYLNHVPDWFKADYSKYYPTLDQIKTNFKAIDWDSVQRRLPRSGMDYYAQKTSRSVTDGPARRRAGRPATAVDGD